MKKGFVACALILIVLVLAGCSSTKATKTASASSVSTGVVAPTGTPVYEASYEIVGYKLLYRAYDNALTFGFLNVLSDAELAQAGANMAALLPGVTSYGISSPGQFTFNLKKTLTKDQFDKFVEEINKKAYDVIY